ncbi:MAG: MptD family putative ECF transporter S component [Clostridia bacterium]|nr:MptD family putative ECF transporter S component [Clostridia bacterium]
MLCSLFCFYSCHRTARFFKPALLAAVSRSRCLRFGRAPYLYDEYEKGFGSAAALPLLWFIVNRLMGEISMPVMWLGIILLIIAAELMRYMFGYDSRLGIRWCVPVLGLVPSCVLLPLYFDRAEYFSRANEEMAADYVSGLDKYATIWMFALVTVLCLAASFISERISEKILKIEG